MTTHDTKRTADVRSRLDVLSEIPDRWTDRRQFWRKLNLPYKQTIRGRRMPDSAIVRVWRMRSSPSHGSGFEGE